jgi:SAM-dependent methyltransferase
MMSEPAKLFDRTLQRHWLRRHSATIAAGDVLRQHVTQDLASRLTGVARQFERGLLVGAGAGAAAPALMATGKVAELVVGEPVLELVRQQTSATVVLDGEALPFADGSFDLAVSLLDLQGMNDLPGALVQLRRLLKPDGLLLASLIGGESLGALARAFAIAETGMRGGASPRIAPMVDVRDLGNLLQRAGFALPVADLDRISLSYASPIALMRELRSLGLANALLVRSRKPFGKAMLASVDTEYRRGAPEPGGRVAAIIEIVTATAWAPGANQQQPLRPGSARTRLADALGVTEHSAGESVRREDKG